MFEISGADPNFQLCSLLNSARFRPGYSIWELPLQLLYRHHQRGNWLILRYDMSVFIKRGFLCFAILKRGNSGSFGQHLPFLSSLRQSFAEIDA